MEPLTHRSPNVIGKQNTLSKKEAMEMQASADKKSQKEKEHPPKPPYYVSEPEGPDGASGERYKTGGLLGKGGFAICYKAELCNERYGDTVHEFALKIVKTHMNQKKMLEKVIRLPFGPMSICTDTGYSVPHGAADPLKAASSKYRRISPRLHLPGQHLRGFGTLPEWLHYGHGPAAKVP